MKQINLRLPEGLRKEAEKYARENHYRNIQELAIVSIREKMHHGFDRETMEVLSDKKLMRSIARALKENKYTPWEEVKKRHGIK